jgi:hypothetical protein
MASWNALRALRDLWLALQLDERLLDLGVDAAHDAREEVVAHEHRASGGGTSPVVSLVQCRQLLGDAVHHGAAALRVEVEHPVGLPAFP